MVVEWSHLCSSKECKKNTSPAVPAHRSWWLDVVYICTTSGVRTIDDCMSSLSVTFCSFCLTAVICMVCVWVHSKQSMFCTTSLTSQPLLVIYYMSACLNITVNVIIVIIIILTVFFSDGWAFYVKRNAFFNITTCELVGEILFQLANGLRRICFKTPAFIIM